MPPAHPQPYAPNARCPVAFYRAALVAARTLVYCTPVSPRTVPQTLRKLQHTHRVPAPFTRRWFSAVTRRTHRLCTAPVTTPPHTPTCATRATLFPSCHHNVN